MSLAPLLAAILPIERAGGTVLRLDRAADQPLSESGDIVYLHLELELPDFDGPVRHGVGIMPPSALRDEQVAATYLRGWATAVTTLFREGSSESNSTFSLGHIDRVSRLLLTPKRPLRNEADVTALLLGPRGFGRYLPPPRMRTADGRLAIDVVTELLPALLPLGPPRTTIEKGTPFTEGEPWTRETPDGIGALLRLVVRDDGGIRDIKEQEVRIVPASGFANPAHIEPYLRAWAEVVGEVLGSGRIAVETFMPHEFVRTDVFELKTAKTQAQLAIAFRSNARFGKWLAKS